RQPARSSRASAAEAGSGIWRLTPSAGFRYDFRHEWVDRAFYRLEGGAMTWEAPDFIEVKMDGEINSYQDDFEREKDDRFEDHTAPDHEWQPPGSATGRAGGCGVSMRRRRRMDTSFLVLLGLTVVALLLAFAKDPQLVARGFQSSGRLLGGVWMELALGFVLAGLLDVLIPPPVLSRWLGGDNLGRSILVGWAAGLV